MAAALDVGERRIGVALTSLIARLPAPYTTIDVHETPDTVGWICDFVAKESISVLVVGLPRDMQGRETEQTKKVRMFAKKLEDELAIPVVMQDEAATSINAEAMLKQKGKPYTKADIDAAAAVIILQDYLSEQERNTA